MRKSLQSIGLIALLACIGMCSHTATAQEWTASIPYEESFDDATHFANGEISGVPTGWLSTGNVPFEVVNGLEWGYTPHSGENLLVASISMSSGRNDITYTPLMEMEAGVTYTVSFYLQMQQGGRTPSMKFTVGQGQAEDAQTTILYEKPNSPTSPWELVQLSFTPETTGQYCFAFWACSALSNDGFIMIDDFSITGGSGDTPEWLPTLPYYETFDDETHYSGDNLPTGWLTTGANPFFTANLTYLTAVSGTYYMITTSSLTAGRQDIAYSPLLEMEAGKEYQLSFYLYMPGGSNTAHFKVTVGQDQSSDVHTNTLTEITDMTISSWQRVELAFTPETTGEYCFGFWACSENSGDGYIAIDDFTLTSEDMVLAPKGNIYLPNLTQDVMNGRQMLFGNQPVKMINNVEGAESYQWSVAGEQDAEISDPTAAEPEITFPATGVYEITLEATNEGGTSTFQLSFAPEVIPAEGVGDITPVQTASDVIDRIYQQNDLPAYREDGTIQDYDTHEVYYDYAVGVNHYYRSIAERVEIPTDVKLKISSLTYNVLEYGIFIFDNENLPQGDDSEKEVTHVIYPEKDGKPDTANPIYSWSEKLVEAYADGGIYKPIRYAHDFETPIEVQGTFYIAVEYDDNITLDSPISQGTNFALCEAHAGSARQ